MIIGIMGAMPDEVDQLCARLENVTKENYAGVEYHCGTLQGKQVVVCCAGMGKANAASTVQVLCTKYGIDKLIFSGIAGNMTSKIGIGDVCVGETVVYHDAELSMIAQSAPFLTDNADESGYEVLVVKQFSITEYVKTATEIVANMIESL